MVINKLNKTLSEKVKRKISASMTGRRLTEEHKVNLSRACAFFSYIYVYIYEKNIKEK
jgi:hypothetical protein